MRVVSLLPSATEIVYRIGAGRMLVGRSGGCDFPPEADAVPVVTRPGAAPDGTGRRARVGSLVDLDEDRLIDLHPDVILTGGSGHGGLTDAGALDRVVAGLNPPPRIVRLNPATVEDILDDVLRVGEALGSARQAERAVVQLRGRLYAAQEYVNPYADGPVVGFIQWTDPLCVAGHWIVQLIERAGGRHPLNRTVPRPDSGDAAGMQQGQRVAGPSVRVSAQDLAGTAPEFLVVCPCGSSLDEARGEADRLRAQDWWGYLPAVRNGHAAIVDGAQMFHRPGPRIAEAFEWLVAWLNDRPDLNPAGFPWAAMA